METCLQPNVIYNLHVVLTQEMSDIKYYLDLALSSNKYNTFGKHYSCWSADTVQIQIIDTC